jgi:hypothetical protein
MCKIQRLKYVTTALWVNTRNLTLIYLYNITYNWNIAEYKFERTPKLHACDFNGPKQCVRPMPLLPTFSGIPPCKQSDSIGCDLNLEKPNGQINSLENQISLAVLI